MESPDYLLLYIIGGLKRMKEWRDGGRSSLLAATITFSSVACRWIVSSANALEWQVKVSGMDLLLPLLLLAAIKPCHVKTAAAAVTKATKV